MAARSAHLVIAFLATVLGLALPSGARANAVEMSPIVGMKHGEIVACGAKAVLPEEALTIEVKLEKSGQDAQLLVKAQSTNGVITAVDIDTASVKGSSLFASAAALGDGSFALGADPRNAEAARFLHEFFVSGASLAIKTAKNAGGRRLTIPGPSPNFVRSAYLNCAGDLYQ